MYGNLIQLTVVKDVCALEADCATALWPQADRGQTKDIGIVQRAFLSVVDKSNWRADNLQVRGLVTRRVVLGNETGQVVLKGPDKGGGLADIAGQRTGPEEQPLHQSRDGLDVVGEVVEGRALLGLAQDAVAAEVVLELLPDVVVGKYTRNRVLLQLGLGPDAAEHERLGRVDGSRGENDLAPGVYLVTLAALGDLELDTNGSRLGSVDSVKQDPGDLRAAGHVQVGPAQDIRGQERRGQRRPLPLAVDKGLQPRDAKAAVFGIDVAVGGDAGVVAGREEAILDNLRQPRVARLPLAGVATVRRINGRASRVGRELFDAAKVRSEVLIAPAVAAMDRHPLVKVRGRAVVVDHGVHGRRAANDAPARPVQSARGHGLLFHGVVVPVMLAVEEFGEHERDLALQYLGVVAAGLEDEHRHVLVLGQLVGEHTSRRASAHNDYTGQSVSRRDATRAAELAGDVP